MAISAQTVLLPSECFLQPESDEESFEVIGRSLPPESLLVERGKEAVESIDSSAVKESLKLTTNALSQLTVSTSSLPSIPKVENDISLHDSDLSTIHSSVSADLSPDEIQQKIDKLIEENVKLKETLHQNNLAMKKQYDTLVLWQEDVMKVHQSHKEKFADTKKYIENLKLENAKLVDALKQSMAEQINTQVQMQRMKTELNQSLVTKQEMTDSCMQSTLNNYSLIDIETSQKRNQELESQIAQMQKEKVESEYNSSVCSLLHEQIQNLEKKVEAQKHLIAQSEENAKKNQESEALQKILLAEIKQLKMEQADKNKGTITQETYDNVQEQLMSAQMHITKLELLRNDDKDIINAKEETIVKLQKLMNEMTDSTDTITALRAQLDLYKADFEAERSAKVSMKAEKDQIRDDLRHLQRRNQQLLEEVERLRGSDYVYVNRPERSSSNASAPQDNKVKYSCPKCNFTFFDYQALENHVFRCITD